jgi:hypothetical protein
MDEDNIMDSEEQEEIENDKVIASEEYGSDFLAGFDEDGETGSSEDDGFDDEEEKEEIKEEEESKEETSKSETEKKEEEPPKEEVKEEEVKEEKPAEPLKIVFLGKEHEVPDEEIKDWVQRGFNEKRMSEKIKQYEEDSKILDEFQDLAFFYKLEPKEFAKRTVEMQRQFEIQKLMEDGTPEDKAKKLFELEYSSATKARANQPKPKAPERDFVSEFNQLNSIRPQTIGLTRLPADVDAAIKKGVHVVTAYLNYENKEKDKEINQLKSDLGKFKEDERKREQAEKAKNAPKSQKGTGGGAKKVDSFLQGFNEDY